MIKNSIKKVKNVWNTYVFSTCKKVSHCIISKLDACKKYYVLISSDIENFKNNYRK